MKLKTVAMTGVLSLAGLGLVGAGAHAVFTTSASSTQPIVAGTPAVALWATGATNGCTSETIAQNNATTCNSITLPLATVGSTFDLVSDIGVVNVGTIPVTLTSLYVTDTTGLTPTPGANASFQSGLGFCVNGEGMLYNGMLTAFPKFDTAPGDVFSGGASLAAAAAGSYYAEFYAGQGPTQCTGSAIAALGSGAETGSDTVTLTVGYTG
jgi:hypothetical protein